MSAEFESRFGWTRVGCLTMLGFVIPLWFFFAAWLSPFVVPIPDEPFRAWTVRALHAFVLGLFDSAPIVGVITLSVAVTYYGSIGLGRYFRAKEKRERAELGQRVSTEAPPRWDDIEVLHEDAGGTVTRLDPDER